MNTLESLKSIERMFTYLGTNDAPTKLLAYNEDNRDSLIKFRIHIKTSDTNFDNLYVFFLKGDPHSLYVRVELVDTEYYYCYFKLDLSSNMELFNRLFMYFSSIWDLSKPYIKQQTFIPAEDCWFEMESFHPSSNVLILNMIRTQKFSFENLNLNFRLSEKRRVKTAIENLDMDNAAIQFRIVTYTGEKSARYTNLCAFFLHDNPYALYLNVEVYREPDSRFCYCFRYDLSSRREIFSKLCGYLAWFYASNTENVRQRSIFVNNCTFHVDAFDHSSTTLRVNSIGCHWDDSSFSNLNMDFQKVYEKQIA